MQSRRFRAASSPKTLPCLFSLAALLVLAGCGNGKPYSCVKVSGKVTYDDGSPIPVGLVQVYFHPQTPATDPRIPPKDGHAEVDGKSGKFDFAYTFGHDDGIIAGDHKVTVRCINNGREVKGLVPIECTDKSKTPLKANTNELPIWIKIPKPRKSTG